MLITCDECKSKFQLDDSLMKEEGVKVKCSNCSKIFMAYPSSSTESSGENETEMQDVQKETEGSEGEGLDFSEMDALLSTEDDSGEGIISGNNSGDTDSGFGFDETDELDLSDMDKMFEDDKVSEASSLNSEAMEELDLDLDEVQDTVPSLGSTNGGSEEIEELDLLDVDEVIEEGVTIEEIEELDLESDDEDDTELSELGVEKNIRMDEKSLNIEPDGESPTADAVEELGLSNTEMEDLFSDDEQAMVEDAKDIEEAELSFDLEKELDMGEISDDIMDNEVGVDEISVDSEEELLEIDEISEASVSEEIGIQEDLDEIEELGLTDLEEMFTLDEDQADEEMASQETGDIDMDEAESEVDFEDIEIDDGEFADAPEKAEANLETDESEEDADEFEEFGLTDLEEMFNLEAEQKEQEPEDALEQPDSIDYGDADVIDGDADELEFKLDEAIAVLDGASEEDAEVEFEEYEELDLSELDEVFDKEEVVQKVEEDKNEELGELDFSEDILPETEIDAAESTTEEDLGIADTSELDFSDIGEMLASEEEMEDETKQELDLPDTPGVVEDESTLDPLPVTPPIDEETSLDFREESQTLVENEIEGVGETKAVEAEDKDDLDLAFDDIDLSDDDFDLSEMEKALKDTEDLELEEDEVLAETAPIDSALDEPTTKEPEPPPIPGIEDIEEEPIEPQEELDFGLDEEDTQEDLFQTEETHDIELEFGVEEEVEEDEIEEPPPIKPPDVKTAETTEDDIEATYDMGLQLDELRKKQAAEKMKGIKTKEKAKPDKKPKPGKKGKPIPFEKKKTSPVLVVLFIIVLLAGVPIVLLNMGIKIPYVSDFVSDLGIADRIKQANIPYISDMVTSSEQDVLGISKISILEPSINGYYVETETTGILFVISGRVRNDYTGLRSFVSIKGQIYSKGNTDVESKTVYAGNILSKKELSTLNPAEIEKRLMNKFGDKRSNFKLKKGKVLPFMIVFMKVPDNLEGYNVSVAGSLPTQAKSTTK